MVNLLKNSLKSLFKKVKKNFSAADLAQLGALSQENLLNDNTVRAQKLRVLFKNFDNNGNLQFNVEEVSLKSLRDLFETMELMSACTHGNSKHKAKLMCNSCYMKYNNRVMASKCDHKRRINHSRGLCRSCYQDAAPQSEVHNPLVASRSPQSASSNSESRVAPQNHPSPDTVADQANGAPK